jgi:signal transduction histidine kinase
MADLAVAVVLTVAGLLEGLRTPGATPFDLVGAALLYSTVAWRRAAPALAVTAGVVGALALRHPGDLAQTVLSPAVVVLCYYLLGRMPGPHRARRYADPLLVALPVPVIWLTPGDSSPVSLSSVWLFFFVLPFATGRALAMRSRSNEQLAEETAHLEAEQAASASAAALAERARIARDLHDVVAHHVSVMAIQVVAARRVMETRPESARAALGAVADSGREALTEVRRMVGALRRDDDEPGLDRLDVVVGRARNAGVAVDLRVVGERADVSPSRDLVAFRVIQEAMTNVIKHAAPTSARVVVRYLPEAVELAVVDTGPGESRTQHRDDGSGHGLVGMHERVAMFGGTLHAGPRAAGGFEVTARLPRAEVSTS